MLNSVIYKEGKERVLTFRSLFHAVNLSILWEKISNRAHLLLNMDAQRKCMKTPPMV